jgi:regulatory protein
MKEWKISPQESEQKNGRMADVPGDEGLVKRACHRAMYILERSDRTEQELRTKLAKNYEPDIVEAAVAYVKDHHYLDDKRYAVNYLSSRGQFKSRRQLEQELLYKKGISREILEEACLETEEQDERELIRSWMEKKHVDPQMATQEELRRFYMFLMRRGFRSEDILNEFHRSR